MSYYKRKKRGVAPWMVTYSDLMTLLLVFFILLFSFSVIDATKFRMITNSFKGVFEGGSEFIMESPPSSPIEMDFPPVDLEKSQGEENSGQKDAQDQGEDSGKGEKIGQEQGQEQLDKLLSDVQKYLEEHELEGIVSATREVRGVELVLQENVLFDSGQAVVKQQAKPFLDKVADLLNTLPNLIEVEGHTDSQKIIQPSQYVSNWNLSGDRAANVVNYFVKEHSIPSERFKISGFADTIPIDTNETASGRMKNRRVVIVITDESFIVNQIDSQQDILSAN